ncbi:MAG: hypothetical protein ACLGIT_13705, partial [Gammaproteobacteria bacterium]
VWTRHGRRGDLTEVHARSVVEGRTDRSVTVVAAGALRQVESADEFCFGDGDFLAAAATIAP